MALNKNEGTDEELKQAFAKALNRHGYGFQYRVLKEAWELCGLGSKWDFCQLDDRNGIHVSAKPSGKLENAYHVAVEVKSKGVKGDECGEGRQVIENAATQVSRGLNGMIEFILGNRQFLSEGRRAHFLPVIFTTANIWVTDVDLSTANKETGNVDLNGSQFTKQPWIAFQYHLSPGLKHSRLPLERSSSLNETMDADYVRTIPIVSAAGIEPFLKWSSAVDLEW